MTVAEDQAESHRSAQAFGVWGVHLLGYREPLSPGERGAPSAPTSAPILSTFSSLHVQGAYQETQGGEQQGQWIHRDARESLRPPAGRHVPWEPAF